MKNVVLTFFLRISVAAINLGIIVFTARYLGAEGRGSISLISLALAFTLMVHQVIGGNPLVYFTRKVALNRLILIAYLWSVPAVVPVILLLNIAGQLPQNTMIHLMALSIIQALLTSNTTLLMAFNKPAQQNTANLIQAIFMALSLTGFFLLSENVSVKIYVWSLYISLITAFGYSLYLLVSIKKTNLTNNPHWPSLIKEILHYGLIIQSTNVIQLLNYRLSFYLINIFAGTRALGVFSTAISLGESIWLFSKSLANIQYPKIINSENAAFQIQLTRTYSNYGFWASLFLLTVLVMLPESLYRLCFGNEFNVVGNLLLIAGPGLVLMSFTTMHAHYFSGIRQNHVNLKASTTGFFVTTAAGFLLIPFWGIEGACWAATFSYLANSLILIIAFKKSSGLSWVEIMPSLKRLQGFWIK